MSAKVDEKHEKRALGGTDEEATMFCISTRTVLYIVAGIFTALGIFYGLNYAVLHIEEVKQDFGQLSFIFDAILMIVTLSFFQVSLAYLLCAGCGLLKLFFQVYLVIVHIILAIFARKFKEELKISSTWKYENAGFKEYSILCLMYTVNMTLFATCAFGFCQLADVCGRQPGGRDSKDDRYSVEDGELEKY